VLSVEVMSIMKTTDVDIMTGVRQSEIEGRIPSVSACFVNGKAVPGYLLAYISSSP
jgi:hypothetical protein